MKIGTHWFGLTLLAAVCAGSAVGALGDLDRAKALYASASYEEALSVLSALPSTEDIEQISEYRALCLLALDKTNEAEQVLERLVVQSPLFVMSSEDVSPRLVDLFDEVRRRTLPNVVQSRYLKAKEAYSARQFEAAV